MSTLKLQERFTLESPTELVWDHLTDPMRTVRCLPGAELTGQDDERTYSGAVKVKVGSVTVAYRGTVVFEEVDPEARYLRVIGKGREKSGSGSAEMTMESRVIALDGGSTEVTVDAEVRVTGKIVRFGRGMIETVSAELFKEFKTRLADELRQAADAGVAKTEGGASGGAEEPGAPGEPGEPTVPGTAEAAETSGAPVARESSAGAKGESAASSDDAIALLPLLFRAFRSWLRRLFGRSRD